MLNEKIVYYRKKNMLTQEELAYQLNVSRQTVTKWETGTIYPNIEYLNITFKSFWCFNRLFS